MSRNKKNLFLFFAFSLFFISCQSTQDIFTMTSPAGELFFIRPIKVKKIPSELKALDFDITVQSTTAGGITEDVILNYTIVLAKENYALADEVQLCFDVDGNRIVPEAAEVIYKEIDSSKNLHIRMTSKIGRDDFARMLERPYETKIVVIIKGTSYSITVTKLNEKLVEMGVLLS